MKKKINLLDPNSEEEGEKEKEEKIDIEEKITLDDQAFDKNNIRYFTQKTNVAVACRRCGQNGHFERMCSQDVRYTCI